MIDPELEKQMGEVLDIVVLGRACRATAPPSRTASRLPRCMSRQSLRFADYFTKIIEEELNVKEVRYTDDVSAFTSYSFKPQMRTVGPKYGKHLGRIRELLPKLDGNAAMNELNTTGVIRLDLGDITAELAREDLLIDSAQMPGFESLSDHGITVVLDTNLTPALIEEGNVREIISKIQTMRKDAGFEVLDRIRVYASGSGTLYSVMERNADDIKGKTLCDEFIFDKTCPTSREWSIGDEKLTLGVEKVLREDLGANAPRSSLFRLDSDRRSFSSPYPKVRGLRLFKGSGIPFHAPHKNANGTKENRRRPKKDRHKLRDHSGRVAGKRCSSGVHRMNKREYARDFFKRAANKRKIEPRTGKPCRKVRHERAADAAHLSFGEQCAKKQSERNEKKRRKKR